MCGFCDHKNLQSQQGKAQIASKQYLFVLFHLLLQIHEMWLAIVSKLDTLTGAQVCVHLHYDQSTTSV